MIYGQDPITKEYLKINDWLNESDDNILLIIDKNIKNITLTPSQDPIKTKNNDKIYLLKRSYLQIPELKHIYYYCILENQQLMINQTFNNNTNYFNLGYYLGKRILINSNEVNNKNLKTKNKIFKLELSDSKEYTFIDKESLLLSQIILSNKNVLKPPKGITSEEKKQFDARKKMENLITKKNLPIKKDVYFEEIIAKALTAYSYQWDSAINFYLRTGEDYFKTQIFIEYHRRYGKTLEEAIANVKQKVLDIDRAFLEAAPRNENNNTVYYRGMQQPFEKLNNIGNKETVTNFISVSTDFNIARKFSGFLKNSTCCLYSLQIDKGIPLIDMISTSKFENEKETLLPRNLIFELVDIKSMYIDLIHFGITNNQFPIYCLKVHLQNQNQFKITTGCKKFLLGSIIPYSPSYITNESKQSKQSKPILVKDNNKTTKKIDNKYQEYIENHKIQLIGKRCPKGYRIHKLTNMCEFYGHPETKTKTNKKSPIKNEQKKSRCKNGTRRNPKTGNCEPK